MARILVLIGPECSGKTGLAKLLNSSLNLPVSEEYARLYVQNVRRPLQTEDIRPIVKGQLKLEQRLRSENPGSPFIVMDTNLLSSLIYADWYFSQRLGWLEEIFLEQNYDDYFLCYPENPWTQDPARGPRDDRQKMLGFFKSELERRKLKFNILTGKQEERLKILSQFLEKNS
jgi:nicotinamide riboside kinase